MVLSYFYSSSTMSSTLNLNPRMTQIGIRCSGTKKCSQRYQINHFCQGFFSAIQSQKISVSEQSVFFANTATSFPSMSHVYP